MRQGGEVLSRGGRVLYVRPPLSFSRELARHTAHHHAAPLLSRGVAGCICALYQGALTYGPDAGDKRGKSSTWRGNSQHQQFSLSFFFFFLSKVGFRV